MTFFEIITIVLGIIDNIISLSSFVVALLTSLHERKKRNK